MGGQETPGDAAEDRGEVLLFRLRAVRLAALAPGQFAFRLLGVGPVSRHGASDLRQSRGRRLGPDRAKDPGGRRMAGAWPPAMG